MDMPEMNYILELGKTYSILNLLTNKENTMTISEIEEDGFYAFVSDDFKTHNIDDLKYFDLDEVQALSLISSNQKNQKYGNRLNVSSHEGIFTVHNNTLEAIISRNELINNFNKFDKNSILITIRDPDREIIPKDVLNYFKKNLTIDFWDITEDFANYKIISDEKALIIKNFILENINEKFIVNCEAGKSRSAGVALAIECIKLYEGDDYLHKTSYSSVKSHSRYYPNLIVYNKIIHSN